MKRVFGLASVALLAFVLASCTLYVSPNDDVSVRGRVRFGIEVSDVIQVFEPTRGAGATYFVGDEVSFRVRTDRDGYITLTALDPNGRVQTFSRDVYVRGGESTVIPSRSDPFVFTVEPPRGLQRVRAAFTPARTGERVRARAITGEDQWTQSIVTEVRPYDVRDIVETRFFIE